MFFQFCGTMVQKCIALLMTLLMNLGAAVSAVIQPISLPTLAQSASTYTVGNLTVQLDLGDGSYTVAHKGITIFRKAYAAVMLDSLLSSSDYEAHSVNTAPLHDAAGNGLKITVLHTGPALPNLRQDFLLYEGRDYLLTQATLCAEEGGTVKTNYISPLSISQKGNVQAAAPRWSRFLEVPFDNDAWVTFETKSLFQKGQSHEAAAFFEPDDGAGLILGSVTHDTWKTGISFEGSWGNIRSLTAYSGANTALTRDQSPHGTVSGREVPSALLFIGIFDHWKTGMNTFAQANTAITPKKETSLKSIPIGWNSWGSVQTDLTLQTAIGISDYISDYLQPAWQTEGETVFVNLDSYWDNLTDDELKTFVTHCRKNGQEAGIYWAPFVSWLGANALGNTYVEGTHAPVLYKDVILKKADGTPYGNDIDGCFPLDVTHPAVRARMRWMIGRFLEAGFTYIKFDFMGHGALEGQHFDPAVQTGMQAYNHGMAYLNELIGGRMFINLSIAPIFPYQYAHGRRIACDAFYAIKDTKYTLNALTYGFWEQELYAYPDPDHLVIWGKDGKASENEARSRLTLGAIAGTSFLTGDNFIAPAGNAGQANERFLTLLTNADILRVAKFGRAFTPVIEKHCPQSASIYRLERDGRLYFAVFNFSVLPQYQEIPVNGVFHSKELWSGKQASGKETLGVWLAGRNAALYEVELL